MWKRIKFWTVSSIIIAFGLTALYYRHQATRGVGETRRNLDGPAVVQQIQQLKQFVTVEYILEKAIGFEEEKIPFGSEKVSLLVQATVLGGMDFSEFGLRDVTIGPDKSVTIQLPQPRILHVYVNDKETQVWDRSKTWWTPWVPLNPSLEQKARLAALEAMQAAALEKGILGKAQENAEATLRQSLEILGFNTIRFQRVIGSTTPKPANEAH
jgi:hypothetical protein